MKHENKWEIWIDRGGTFTDVIGRDAKGNVQTVKLLSENSKQYPDAALEGIRRIVGSEEDFSLSVDKIHSVKIGTTLATNRLLERTGEKVLLVTTQGFKDVLRIGYQNRPDLFAIDIIIPSQLYSAVVEIPERISAKGKVIYKLDEHKVLTSLKKYYKQGYRVAAIVLMHGYKYKKHEKIVAKLARQTGFSQISVSHQTVELMKFIPRGNTTVMDAYLSPLIDAYSQTLKNTLEETPLSFMQSNGGLIQAKLFQGKNSILSGPAAGVIAGVKTASRAGFSEIIGFDMGGTSTDVFHYCGKFERSINTEISGIHLQTPVMKINSVAAGGGSKLIFDNGRFRVGPSSAGAFPGPACYGNGGPLTLTDANLLLGRIQAKYFPQVFGRSGKERLNMRIAKNEFKKLKNNINTKTNYSYSAEEIAEGFLEVAVQNMANAVKKITVERGYDVSSYVISCFGGAAGQHACRVANILGIKKIHIHPLSGLLSAYGMGLAKTSIQKEKTIEQPLSKEIIAGVVEQVGLIRSEAVALLIKQGTLIDKIDYQCISSVKYSGTDTTIEVPLSSLNKMKKQFHELHEQQFGFKEIGRDLILESISVEVFLTPDDVSEANITTAKNRDRPRPIEKVEVYKSGKNTLVPIYDRAALHKGQNIKGPAIIIDPNSTIIVEYGWIADINIKGHLTLSSLKHSNPKIISNTKVDPIRLEIFNNLFMSVAEQMGVVLANTATSVNIKERLDFSCALFDPLGRLIANAPHLPIHLGSMGESIQTVIRERGGKIKPGESYALNAPYNGGTHLPDITVITPVFDDKKKNVLFYVASRGHHADIGGTTPSSIPPFSKYIEEEGVLIDNFLLTKNGKLRETQLRKLLTSSKYPARNPEQNIEDFRAQIAANNRGAEELLRIINKYGIKMVHAYMNFVRINAKECVEAVISKLKSGRHTLKLDHGGKITVSISVKKKSRRVKVDFTGTSGPLSSNFNAPTSITKACVLYVFRCLVNDSIPLNDGCLEPIDIIIPKKCFLNPEYPSAVVAGNVETAQAVTSALFGALNKLAAGQTTMNNFTFGNKKYQYYETICGGAGATNNMDGASAIHTHMTNTRLTDPEVLEWRFPVLLENFSIRKNSGGKGRKRGGDGVIRRIKFLEKLNAAIVSSFRIEEPFGLDSGKPGKAGINYVLRSEKSRPRENLGGSDQTLMKPGDVFVIETPGGGGVGKEEFD